MMKKVLKKSLFSLLCCFCVLTLLCGCGGGGAITGEEAKAMCDEHAAETEWASKPFDGETEADLETLLASGDYRLCVFSVANAQVMDETAAGAASTVKVTLRADKVLLGKTNVQKKKYQQVANQATQAEIKQVIGKKFVGLAKVEDGEIAAVPAQWLFLLDENSKLISTFGYLEDGSEATDVSDPRYYTGQMQDAFVGTVGRYVQAEA